MTKRVLTIVGSRPQFIKAAVMSRALAARGVVEERLVHTGQHYDANMSDVFFRELDLPAPAYHLGVAGGGHADMVGRMLTALEPVLQHERPDAAIVYGDTNSTLAGALAAAQLGVSVVHVEAGLRSYNWRMPEEINRRVTDHVSTLLLCPTQRAVANLAREGISAGVHWVGDVMYDAMRAAVARASDAAIVGDLGLAAGAFALCTLHRAETTDDPAARERALAFVEAQAREQVVVFPVHPRMRNALRSRALANVRLIDPVSSTDMHALLSACALVLTDSGGLQKEAYFHRKPCITLRNETEWVETVEAGWNRLWTASEWRTPRREIADYGDGRAGEACADALEHFLA